MPTHDHRVFEVWIRIKGDWTEALEKLINERNYRDISILTDGPFSSPMESVRNSEIAICIAAGIGITPFVALLEEMIQNPRGRSPGRIHLLWIVKHEEEITWIARRTTECISQLRNANRPDRFHLELYVTSKDKDKSEKEIGINVILDKSGKTSNVIDHETDNLLTPHLKKKLESALIDLREYDSKYKLAKEYPILGCRLKMGRPHWDKVFGYWVHLYPRESLDLYCCGPKKLVKLLREKCKCTSRTTKTKFRFVHEAFA